MKIVFKKHSSTDTMRYDGTYPKSKEILSEELPKISLVPSIWLMDSSPDILLEWLGVWWPDGDFFSKIPGRTAVASPTKVIAYKIHQILASLSCRSSSKRIRWNYFKDGSESFYIDFMMHRSQKVTITALFDTPNSGVMINHWMRRCTCWGNRKIEHFQTKFCEAKDTYPRNTAQVEEFHWFWIIAATNDTLV